ncbi:MAG: energy transducer TonB [Verrucomicrobiota bacterium]
MTLHELYDKMVPQEKRWFGVCIFFSFCFHLLGLFMVKLAPVVPDRLIIPAPEVTLAVFTSEFGDWLEDNEGGGMGWINLRDPRLVSQPIASLPMIEGLLEDTEKMPALQESESTWIDLSQMISNLEEKTIQGLAPASQRALENIVNNKPLPMPLIVEAPPSLSGTSVVFTGDLASREIILRKDLPQPEATQPYGVTIVLLGVNRLGVVEFALVEEGSKNSELDYMALETLRDWRFKEAGDYLEILTWGRVVVSWDFQETKKPGGDL